MANASRIQRQKTGLGVARIPVESSKPEAIAATVQRSHYFWVARHSRGIGRASGEHYLIYWRATTNESSELARRSKAEGTTPYAAFCVAFLLAFRQVSGANFKNKMMRPVNIRRFMRNIGADMMFNYAPAIPLSLSRDPQEEFWGLARKLKQSISEKTDRLNAYEYLLAGEQLHTSVHKLISLLRQSKGSYDFAFSNVGRLDIGGLSNISAREVPRRHRCFPVEKRHYARNNSFSRADGPGFRF